MLKSNNKQKIIKAVVRGKKRHNIYRGTKTRLTEELKAKNANPEFYARENKLKKRKNERNKDYSVMQMIKVFIISRQKHYKQNKGHKPKEK